MNAVIATIESVADIRPLLAEGRDLCLVEESSEWPGELVFIHPEQERFVRDHIEYLSPLCMLNDVFMLRTFLHQLRDEGTSVFLLPSALPIVDGFDRWSQPLEVKGLHLPGDGTLYPFQQFALQRAIELAETARTKVSGFFFNFGTGCIQGDAEIVFNRGGNGRRVKLRDLVHKFNGGTSGNGKKWDPDIPTYVQREVDGVVRLGRLRAAWRSGVKQTYTVTTNTGRFIRATDEHPFLTERGWLRLDELRIGDEVHVRGEQTRRLPRQPKPHYRQVGGLVHHPFAVTEGKNRVPYHRLVAEARINGVDVEAFISHLRDGSVVGYDFLDPDKWAVHHIDHDSTNNAPENLEVLTHEEHHRQHAHDGKTNNVLYKIETERVMSVEPWGLEETYDLEVDDDPHNFIANGFVVHNTGKSVIAAAGAQEMFNRELIDVVVFFTMRKVKINMSRVVNRFTELTAVVPEGTKEKRQRQYAEGADVIVLNVEKAKFDRSELAELLENKRVLWVADEVQIVLRGKNTKNQSRKAIEELMKLTKRSYVWPMSASIVRASPLRYHDVFDLAVPRKHPLGTRESFIAKYAETREGYFGTEHIWDLDKLVEVRHRVSSVTQAVRKTDPGVRDRFKGMTTIEVEVQQSSQELALAKAVIDDLAQLREQAQEAALRGEHVPPVSSAQHSLLLRAACNTPAALLASESDVARRIVAAHPKLVEAESSKFEMICDKIKEIRSAGDQVVVFTHWTNLTLFQLSNEFGKANIKHVVHYGTGMSDKVAQQAQDDFIADPSITVFLSSDAGAFGLNFTNARYVIHVEPIFDWDTFMQRSDRIDRADSYLDDLTSYVYICADSIEERVWKTMNARRRMAAVTQGTVEVANRLTQDELDMASMSDTDVMESFIRES